MKTQKYKIAVLLMISVIIQAQVPEDAQHQFSEIHYYETPSTNRYGIAWGQAATLQSDGISNNGYIHVDYLKLIEEDPSSGTETILHEQNYSGSGALTRNEGGLFVRFPSWYHEDSYLDMTNSSRSGGYLTINVGQEPERISHFWGVRKLCELGKRHKVEIRLKISGDIGFQLGMDYWEDEETTDNTKIKEAFYSNFYGDTEGAYIVIKYPDYNETMTFDRTDYGFTSDGIFFVSKRLVNYVGGTSVSILGNINDWSESNMILDGDYYLWHSGYNLYSSQLYCFKINPSGNSFFVPHAVIDNLMFPSDAVSNNDEGYNFKTFPTTITANTIVEKKGVNIYPNPASRYLIVETPFDDSYILQIYCGLGIPRLTKTIVGKKEKINVDYLAPGYYNLHIKNVSGDVFYTMKLLIEK